MKKMYRIVLSRGNDFIFEENIIRQIMTAKESLQEMQYENRSIWINKAHIVCIFLDKVETSYEKQKEITTNLPPPEEQISIEKITELRKKAQELTGKFAIKEKSQNELKNEALKKIT